MNDICDTDGSNSAPTQTEISSSQSKTHSAHSYSDAARSNPNQDEEMQSPYASVSHKANNRMAEIVVVVVVVDVLPPKKVIMLHD